MKNLVKEKIRYACGKCYLGLILVAESKKGVCALFIGNERHILEAELKARFPNTLVFQQETLPSLALILEYLEKGEALDHAFPLDERGSPFQKKVWQAIRKIPLGKTATYTAIAQKIGSPKAIRAVASACGANPVSLITPCHRVIRSDGSLAGYRWGLGRKKILLEVEQKRLLST